MDEGTTRHAVLKRLLEGPATAQEAAEAAEVDPSAARRHLEALLERGWAAAEFRQEGMGRPKKYYAITDQGREAFPRRYGLLLEGVAAALARRDDGALAAVMDEVAEELAEELGRRVPDDAPLEARVEAAAEALRGVGFPVEVEPAGEGFAIVRRDCVFLRLARAHSAEVCGHLDTGLVSRLVGEPANLVRCIPWGDGACRHEVRVGSPDSS